jgi:4-hydroxymandelate oxidase
MYRERKKQMRLECQEAESVAQGRLTKPLYDFIAGGADDESAVAANSRAWRSAQLLPHVLADVSDVDTSVEIFGRRLAAPLFVSPMGSHRRVDDGGELTTAALARDAGVGFVMGIAGFCAIEEVGEVGGTNWLQLYWLKDRDILADMVARAEASGFAAVCVTVDAAVPSLRLRDKKNDYHDPSYMKHGCLEKYGDQIKRSDGVFYFTSLVDRTISWQDIEWLVGVTKLPVVVKGIIRADDAKRAVDAGARGVFVSNHGGRQLGQVRPTALALRDVADALGGTTELFVDGGVRSATDLLTAVSLGARAAGVGRPVLYALGSFGPVGLAGLFETFKTDLGRIMALCGASRIDQIDRSLTALHE